jgi:hypothetical protein
MMITKGFFVMQKITPSHLGIWVGLVALSLCLNPIAHGKSLAPPADPTQSITYWKPHTLSPRHDALVAKAQGIFSVLLRAWDNSRLEPSLFVVDSTAGPWAASLADGNILLSRAAIEACSHFGHDRADHLLASCWPTNWPTNGRMICGINGFFV